jgi:hypothetical protein
MNPLKSQQNPSSSWVSTPGSAAPSDVASLLELLREPTPTLVSRARCDRLGLEAFGCVLTRRLGQAPAPAQAHRYMEALANNVPLRRTLIDAADALARAGVPTIVYKGQDYLERIYGDLGARAMADVDLLVRVRDLGSAERALLDAGFVADRACKLMHERKFCKNGVAIDLHHALLQPERMAFDHDALFERACASSIGHGLLALEATDALLVHCVNQTVKGYCLPASSYVELQALLARADVSEAIARAASNRMLSALYTSLAALGALGHRGAALLATRVQLSKGRKRALDAVILSFALRSVQRETPNRATMLALKATLVDDSLKALRFATTWAYWQMPFKAPRALACEADAPRAGPDAAARHALAS